VAARSIKAVQGAGATGGNLFAGLMDAVVVRSLGQITEALFEVGGQYRRGM